MKKIILIISLICVVIFALIVAFVKPLNVFVKDKLNLMLPDKFTYQVYYQNNELVYDYSKLDFENCDVREIQVGNGRKYLVNHSRGFAVGAPRDAKFDFTCAQEFIKVNSSKFDMVISKEYAHEENTKEYIAKYLNKYIYDETYTNVNRITLHSDNTTKVNDYWMQVVAFSRTPAPMTQIEKNTYVYAYIYTGTPHYYRIMFKADKYSDELINEVYKVLYTFSDTVEIKGVSGIYTDFKPVIPKNWTEETKKVYEKIANAKEPYWGVYNPQAVRDVKTETIDKLEEKVDFEFPVLLEYIYYWEEFPTEGMEKAYQDGKIVELTMQTSTVMNADLNNHNPFFDVLDGVYDAKLREFAKKAAEFGKPFVFRLNNEMNSDWTSYGGNVILNDPDLYVSVWRKIYNIFEEEGVNNAIWVFNPNNISFPPCGYNSALAYYPGNEYVQLFGITGYNTGDYYKDLYGETWREFEDIYDEIYRNYKEAFSKFPWMITEFASASVGGDKAKWIDNMFASFAKYPEIKIAVWFNSEDYDPREAYETVVSRAYKLDENQFTIDAFKKGVKEHKTGSLLK